MKLFQIYKWQIITVLFFVLSYGCQDNNDAEPLFDEVRSVRIDNAKAELKAALQSSPNGWKITYFTDDSQLGGFTFLFNFINEGEVTMDSDFGNPDTSVTSLYDVVFGSTLKLSFTTKNVLHELSDGANFPNDSFVGQGYRGDFEFLWDSYDGDDIIFRVNRDTSNFIRFSKATADDVNDISKNMDIWESFPSTTFGYKIGDEAATFSYDFNTRYASNIDNNETDGFGVGFTPVGITISPAIDLNGTLHSNFILSDDKRNLTSENSELVLEFLVPPIDVSLTWITEARPGIMPQSFIDVFSEAKTLWDPSFGGGFPLGDIIELGDSNVTFAIGTFSAVHGLNFTGVLGEPEQLNISKGLPGLNWGFVPVFDPMVDLLVEKAPYIVTIIDEDTSQLTSVTDATFSFTLFK